MKHSLFLLPIGAIFAIHTAASTLTVTVPGSANPWLAGAADGTTAAAGDEAPAQSPVLVTVNEGDELKFYVSGRVGYQAGSESGPEGMGTGGLVEYSHSAENGLGGISWAPVNALIGVFLGDDAPVVGAEPVALDFALGGGARDANTRLPALAQPFFIGNGVAAGPTRQTIYVPIGATRLFLGTMDGAGWFNNTGSFSVNIVVNGTGASNSVTWGAPAEVADPADVATDGTLVVAGNLAWSGRSGSTAVTLNTVPFEDVRDLGAVGNGGTAYDLTGGDEATSDYDSASAPFTGLDADYQKLLGTGMLRYGTTARRKYQLSFNNLTIGENYMMQFWVNGSNSSGNPFDANHYRTVIAGPGNSVALDPNSTNADGGIGQWVTGTFTAAEPGLTVEFAAEDSGYAVLNGFQLRQTSGGGGGSGPQIVESTLPLDGGSLTASGGTGPYVFTVQSGDLPPGMFLADFGLLYGSVFGAAVDSVTIRVTDSLGAFSDKIFTYSVGIGLPDLEVRRVVIQDVGGTARAAIFELAAGDDVALSPDGPDETLAFSHASRPFEYRIKVGATGFGNWQRAHYFPFNYPPFIPFDSAVDTRVEFRALDADGNRSRPVAYDLKKGIKATPDQSSGVSVSPSRVLLTDVGTTIVKLFTEDLNGASLSTEVAAVDRETGKISVIYNGNRGAPEKSTKASIIVPNAPMLDAAVGLLMPFTGANNDGIQDFVVVAGGELKVIANKAGSTPVLQLSISFSGLSGVKRVAVGDVNGDGADDIVAFSDSSMAVYRNLAVATSAGYTGMGFASPVVTALDIDAVRSVTMGDLDGDGVDDVCAAVHETASPAGQDSVLCALGRYEDGLVSSPTFTPVGKQAVDIVMAGYTGHRLGQRDVIVGLVDAADPGFSPGATHEGFHKVLVHEGAGVFNSTVPVRRVAAMTLTATEEVGDKDYFNLAVRSYHPLNGPLVNRIVPEIVSCQYHNTEGGGTEDSGFLPPPEAGGAYHWMLNDINNAGRFGFSAGRTRRIGLGDLSGNPLMDVVLANADTGNLELQTNLKPLLNPQPPGVVLSKSLPQPKQTKFIPGGRLSGAPTLPWALPTGVSYMGWTFSYTIPGVPSDAFAFMEYQLNGGSWTHLPSGFLLRRGAAFSTTTTHPIPLGVVRFRCAVRSYSSEGQGIYTGYSVPTSLVRSIESPSMTVTAVARPDSSPTQNVSTHESEFMEYVLTYTNAGTEPANNVVIAGAIPPQTTFGGNLSFGGTSGFVLTPTDPAKATTVSWNLGTVMPGETGERKYFVRVLTKALANLKGKPIELKQLPVAAVASPATTSARFLTAVDTGDGYGVWSSAPGQGLTNQVATGPGVATPVVPPLTLTQTVNIAANQGLAPGAEIEVRLELANYAPILVQNVVVEDIIEPTFALKSVRLRPSDSLTSGSFNSDNWDDEPLPNDNPGYLRKNGDKVVRWNIGTMAPAVINGASSPVPSRVTMDYKIIVKDDVDLQAFLNGIVQDYTLSYGGLSATGTLQTGGTTSALTSVMPRLSNRTLPPTSPLIAKVRLHQQPIALVGNDPATAYEPADPTLQMQKVGGESFGTVPEAGLVRVKLKANNDGDKTARGCLIHYRVPYGMTFLGWARRNNVLDNLASNYEYYDWGGDLIPFSDWGARIKEVRMVIIRVGNLAAGEALDYSFILEARYPPNHQALASDSAAAKKLEIAKRNKPTETGWLITSRPLHMDTDSLVQPVLATPGQTPLTVVRPVAFDIDWDQKYMELTEVVGSPIEVYLSGRFTNVGWTDAVNVEVIADLPPGSEHVNSVITDHNDNTIGGPGVVKTIKEGGVSKKVVSFAIGTLERAVNGDPITGYTKNLLSTKRIGMTVRFPANAKFPANRVLRRKTSIKGQDAAGRFSQGSSVRILPDNSPKPPVQKNLWLENPAQLASDEALMRVKPAGAGKLVAGKCVPQHVRTGQFMDMQFWAANSGGSPLTNINMALQVPTGTVLVSNGTTPGHTEPTKEGIIRWRPLTIGAGETYLVNVRVQVNTPTSFEGGYLEENSFIVEAMAGAALETASTAKARTLVQSSNQLVAGGQWLGAQLMAFGASLFNPSPAVKDEIATWNGNGMTVSIIGADVIDLNNGLWIVQLGNGKIVAGGAGNIVAGGAGNIVAGGAGNVVAAGAGNIVAGGAGNLITVPGVGLCSTQNLNATVASIVAGGAGNIVAAGGGNLIANDGASLVANDGASFGTLSSANIVAGGAGNIVAGGAGNIIVVGGAGFYTGGPVGALAARASQGGALNSKALISGASIASLNKSSLVGEKAAGLIANDGGSLIANDGASLIANDGSSLLANDGASLLANDGASLIANDGASILSDQGGGFSPKQP